MNLGLGAILLLVAVVLFVLAVFSDENYADFLALGLAAFAGAFLATRSATPTDRSAARTARAAAPAPSSVPEVPAPGEDHRGAGGFDRVDHVGVALRAARLDQRRHARVEREPRAVREREERVRGE